MNADQPIVDLRSDTVTFPTEAMLERMQRAPLGDDSRDGDPTVRALEDRGGTLTGKESALFVPSGTMGNLLAMLAHAERGMDVFADSSAHLLNSELGSVVTIAGLVPNPMPGHRGAMKEAALTEAIQASARPGLIAMETTHNGAGGAVLPLSHMERIHALGQTSGVPVHLDGARLFNASIALGVPPAHIAAHADSVMFCLSKGLSAPVGSLLCGRAEFIARARGLRKLVGGNLRQAGIVAAAGLVALETMVERLREDHAAARRLAAALTWLDPALAEPHHVETNILRIDLSASPHDAAAWADGVKPHGILVQASGPRQLRLVTHRHIDDAAVRRTIRAFAAVGGRPRPVDPATD
ncbi:beta-eliminating lyase-related protein [Bradyrhizobium sp. CCGUVB1N3]|uniref:GntG family PLP-dependent aldolase n=1 Tax=Bradyrhizobium sp. CCGUVB1N3 TaxID=2949629 RepID=UPI0020B28CDE|nr:GntG family PLP-dependent aldolase [Bradyrhizobium sp. CCGUVB1N3]MCP3469401.1 beta-eliminating lyase-related protein [Bradyrhizobium sp. CCGUVB1N3]